jgi:nitrogen fixation/metabolism regulation signal transduction histidine kinase
MDRSLLIGLVHRTKGILGSIEELARLSREKFIDREFADSFYKEVTADIAKIDLLMDGFMNFIKSTTPVLKKDTVNTLIDEALKKHQDRVGEKKIRILKRFEKELPETIVPDEQMTFILDSVLQYAVASVPPGGIIEFLTRSLASLKTMGEDRPRNIEIMVSFTRFQKPGERLTKELEAYPAQKEAGLDLLLQLVYVIVQENQGTMEHEAGERKERSSIVLKFPAERRRATRYQPVYE